MNYSHSVLRCSILLHFIYIRIFCVLCDLCSWVPLHCALMLQSISMRFRPETDQEKFLKEEIDHLKMELAKEIEKKVDYESALNSSEQISYLRGQISQKEKDLYLLISELDDKVRFGQRGAIDVRPGSGSGRIPLSVDRPPSQSGLSDDSRNMELVERPGSRGRVDLWSRPMDRQRGFQRSRDSGFLSSGNTDRYVYNFALACSTALTKQS